ncbi:MAG: FKBP-type peptidyl-prolyl cis-trans isomerase [Porphyromonadaceae bacterium]|nr:FKBP-type peptidyl-prolyl cis-trans isomerase [Porphyromonadaceae bacterium]
MKLTPMRLKNVSPRMLGLLLFLALGLGLQSCGKEIDHEREHRVNNERAFLAFADSTSYEKVSLPGFFGDGYVYIKWMKRSEVGDRPKKTDQVRLRYRYYQLTAWQGVGSGLIYTNYTEENPKPQELKGELEGVRIAIQNMRVGDVAMVAIPWYLALGAKGGIKNNVTIPIYSSLLYQIELLGIND